jgi:methionyl-tRNA formyltransferase
VVRADAGGVTVACAAGGLRITELQRAGGKRLGAREFLAGFPLQAGERCRSPRAE